MSLLDPPVPVNKINYSRLNLQKILKGQGNPSVSTVVSTSGTPTASSFRATSSTFANWGFPIGSPQNFNAIMFDMNSWDSANIPTILRVIVRQTDQNGAILADSNIQPVPNGLTGVSSVYVTPIVFLNQTVANAGAGSIWVDVFSNGYFSLRTTTAITYSTTVRYNTNKAEIYNASPATNQATTAPNTNLMVTTLLTNTLSTESMRSSSLTYNFAASTFNAWGTPIGTRSKFNKVFLLLKWYDLSTPPPTQINFKVRDTGSPTPNTNSYAASTVVSTGYAAVPSTIQLNVPFLVAIDVDTVNTSNQLWFEYFADGHVASYGLASTFALYDAATYGMAKYGTGVTNDGAGYPNNSSSQHNLWAQTVYVDHDQERISNSDAYKTAIQAIAQQPFTDVTSLMPPTIYALEGRECNAYFSNFLMSTVDISNYKFNVTCTKGTQENDRWTYTPVSSDSGTTTWQLDIYFNNVLIKTVTASLVTKALTAGAGITRKMVTIGDSTTASGIWLAELFNLFASDASMTLSMQGSISMSVADSGSTSRTVKHDGVSGKTIAWHYANSGSGVLIDTSTSANASSFRGGSKLTSAYASTGVSTIAVTGTAGLANGMTVYPGFATANAEALTVASFTSTTITFTGTTTKTHASGETVYWDSGTFSFANYLTNQGITMSSNDWVMVHLGINDVFSYLTDATLATQMATMCSQLDAMITSIKAAVSGVRIGLLMTIPPSHDQDPFGINYQDGQTQWRYRRNRNLWLKQLLAIFGAYTNVYLLPFHLGLDTVNNMQTTSTAINARNSTTFNKQSNGVHPANIGYWQLSDTVRSILKGFES